MTDASADHLVEESRLRAASDQAFVGSPEHLELLRAFARERVRGLASFRPRSKLEVWKRDKGRCVECGSADNLHFDHIIPWSRGGSSLTAQNVQLLCARHNITKRDRIQ
jgi:5-methylcytosine-specific restriction endonuclease McrA